MKSTVKQIARQRIQILFQQAKNVHKSNPQLSRRYIALARKIAMAAKIRLPTAYRRQICRKCNTLLVPGENCRVRIKQKREPHVVVACLNCGRKTRFMLRKRRKMKFEPDNQSNETSHQV